MLEMEIDLWKVFDCLSHELLMAKLDEYGIDKGSLILIYNYLSKHRQSGRGGRQGVCVKINDSFSSWKKNYLEFYKDQY